MDSITTVRDYWDATSCGEVYLEGATHEEQFQAQASARYTLEPYLRPFARFDGTERDVLEIGVGLGADHAEWAKSGPRRLVGIDITPRAIQWTGRRLAAAAMSSTLAISNCEYLPFRDSSFDLVYSWGVLHHVTPNPQNAFDEANRVLRPGGELRAMIYHRPSFVGLMLWVRYALLRLRPWSTQAHLYANYLESPGTQGFTMREARMLLRGFDIIELKTVVSFGDLLEGAVGHRHGGLLLGLAKLIWPRWLIRHLSGFGLCLLVKATKTRHIAFQD